MQKQFYERPAGKLVIGTAAIGGTLGALGGGSGGIATAYKAKMSPPSNQTIINNPAPPH